jgi:class 3 adenylate cyclase
MAQGREYRGKGVHEAARIGALAQAGQILASVDTITAAGVAQDLSDRRTVILKGVTKPVDVASIVWQ